MYHYQNQSSGKRGYLVFTHRISQAMQKQNKTTQEDSMKEFFASAAGNRRGT
jgi:hypothetical protein